MEPNVVLPLLSATLSFLFALLLLDQWLERRRTYQLIWSLGMAWFGISAGTELLGGVLGWSEPLYRAWYLFGAVFVAAWLGLGTMYLLGRTRFGYAAAGSVLLAGLFTVLSQVRQQYPDTGMLPYAAFAIALVGAVAITVETRRGSGRWARIAGALVIGGSIAAAPIVLLAPVQAPGYALDAAGIPVGSLMPGSVRLLTPLFNVTGGFALVLGALYSVAAAVRARRLDSRVPATILIALGGFVPSMTSGLTRFGITETFYLGELLGVLFLFAGFLVSIDVFHVIRVPFTRRVLYARHEAA
ncbi:MAG TPA: hypothetical protein VGK16_10965 [Candidatus Limnocylindrales bacterium]|jgi:hypothetical protein